MRVRGQISRTHVNRHVCYLEACGPGSLEYAAANSEPVSNKVEGKDLIQEIVLWPLRHNAMQSPALTYMNIQYTHHTHTKHRNLTREMRKRTSISFLENGIINIMSLEICYLRL